MIETEIGGNGGKTGGCSSISTENEALSQIGFVKFVMFCKRLRTEGYILWCRGQQVN